MATLFRSRRPFAGDVRFLVGIVLVVVSIAGVWFIVTNADHAVPVLQASRTIARGEAVHQEDFHVVEVNLGAADRSYLRPGDLEDGTVATRTLAKGELVPSAVLIDRLRDRSTTIVIESTTSVPSDVRSGTRVEIWQAPPLDDGRAYDTPRVLVDDVVVREVIAAEGMLADTTAEIEIVVDRDDVADILTAVTGGSALSVIPIGAGS